MPLLDIKLICSIIVEVIFDIRYHCIYYPQSYIWKSDLRRHTKHAHLESRESDVCDKSFETVKQCKRLILNCMN